MAAIALGKWSRALRAYLSVAVVTCLLLVGACQRDQKAPRATDGCILRIAVLSDYQTCGYNILGTDVILCPVCFAISDQLYAIGPTSMQPRLLVAEDCRQVDPLTYTVGIKQGVMWHDGVPLTAADVSFTYRLLKKYDVPKFRSSVAALDRVDVLDKNTVRFVFSEPIKTLPLAINLLPKHVWEPIVEQAEKTDDPQSHLLEYEIRHPVDNGPFRFVEEVVGSHIWLEANEAYHLGTPLIDGILIDIYKTTDDAISALERGEVDFLNIALEARHIRKLKDMDDVTLRRNPGNELHYIGFNLRREPFADISFRKAVAYLIDKEWIVDEVLEGAARPIYSVIPPGVSPWHYSDVTRFGQGLDRESRLEKARATLSEAGYSWDENGLAASLARSGKPITILTPTKDYDPFRAEIGEDLAERMREIGIDAVTRPIPLSDLKDSVVLNDYDMCLLGWHLIPGFYHLYTFFHSSNAVKGGYNTSGYANRDFDSLIEQVAMLKPTDQEGLQELLAEAQEMIARDMPIVPLYYREKIEAYREDRVAGWIDMAGGLVNTWSFRNFHPAE